MVVGRRTGDWIPIKSKVDHQSFVMPPIIITIVLLFRSYCRSCGCEEKDNDYIDAFYGTAVNMHKAKQYVFKSFQIICTYYNVLI